ncbi:uncharacterized protein BDV17DRAFT_225875 [Aspergillus undulatus]|uniref:uncharacterized protein n=1 Tax=Aspergillus undulatus TaxID=1810928 RepID=UPI003CCDB72E
MFVPPSCPVSNRQLSSVERCRKTSAAAYLSLRPTPLGSALYVCPTSEKDRTVLAKPWIRGNYLQPSLLSMIPLMHADWITLYILKRLLNNHNLAVIFLQMRSKKYAYRGLLPPIGWGIFLSCQLLTTHGRLVCL